MRERARVTPIIKYSEPKIEFAGSFVGSIDHHLHQVKDQQHDHGLSHVVMNAP